MLRTHTCGQLRSEDVGQQVTLCGWVDTYRDHSGVLFIDLRDRYGKTQVVFAPESGDETLQLAQLAAVGICDRSSPARWPTRPEGTVNPKLATGADRSPWPTPRDPQHAASPRRSSRRSKDLPGEDLRLKYRYLDLRRPEMQQTLVLAASDDQADARLLRRAGVHRGRDADARPQHARGRPRLPGAQPRPARRCSTPCRSRRSSTSRS